MRPETTGPLPYELLETPNGCIVRWECSRGRFHVSSLVFLALSVAFLYVPLAAAGVFLAGQVFQAPWHLLLLAGLFVVQVGSVGPAPIALWLLCRECLDLAWKVLFACFGHHDLEVTPDWLYFGQRVGSFGNILNRRKCRRVPTQALQQIVVVVYSGQAQPASEGEGCGGRKPQTTEGSASPGALLLDKFEEHIRDLASGFTAEGNGELAIIERPGAGPTPYYTGYPTALLRDLAEKLHRYISRGRPSFPPVAVIDKPVAPVRAEWEAMAREARELVDFERPRPMPETWWNRKRWVRVALLLNSLAGVVALLRLIWRSGLGVRGGLLGTACVFVEILVVLVFTTPVERPAARADRPSSG